MSQLATPSENAGSPHSRLVAKFVPSGLQLTGTRPAPSSLPPPASPPIPPRSPLRPKFNAVSLEPRSISLDSTADSVDMTLLRSRSFGILLESRPHPRPQTPEKPLPITPISSVPDDEDREDHREETPSPEPILSPSVVPISKRTHALLELLSSERAYASDLALIRDIHLPLAIGQPAPFQATPATPPSSGSSSRTLSTASDSSSGSALVSPMTREDAKIIFNNVAEIALFADAFTERLEEALGSVLEGGTGEDHVGALFLELIPTLEPLYTMYITRHSTALEHLNNLPQSTSLAAYLAHTRTLAQSLTHAWDLPSLLIKPVQRLLKYSLLLGAIIDETPATHGDKENLKQAREKMEAVAHGVNEGRRRREVVKEVLTGIPSKKVGEMKAKKKGLYVGVAASVSLGRMKSVRAASFKVKEGAEANQEAEQVARLGEELKACDAFIRAFAKEATHWAKSVTSLTQQLKDWTGSFGKVIGVSKDQKSEAFEAFHEVIEHGLLPICQRLEAIIETKLLVELALLTDSTSAPERLLEAMRTLEPLHYGLLNFNVSKSRPPTPLLDASKSYVALRAQLFAELPKYLELLNRGLMAAIKQFTTWQAEFWMAIRDKWAELWDALKVDGEMQGEAKETLRVWWSRFADVEASTSSLHIIRMLGKKDRDRDKEQEKHVERSRPRPRGKSVSDTLETGSTTSTAVASSILAALEPIRFPPPSSASSQTLVPSPVSQKSRNFEKKMSNESLHSKKSNRSTRSHKHSNSSVSQRDVFSTADLAYGYEQMMMSISSPPQKHQYSRTTSMPISLPMPLRKSSSQGRMLDAHTGGDSTSSSLRSLGPPTPPLQQDFPPDVQDQPRGRPSRKPSMKRRLTDTLRPNTSSNSRQQRSPSLPSSMGSRGFSSPQPSPSQPAFLINNTRAETMRLPAMYACQVVHPLNPPDAVSYQNIPFFTLRVGDVYDILQEAGHPSLHRDLPLYVDDGEDCLLLVRNTFGDIGWVLASFLLPVD
ncbi:hypothetical protein PHLCEN_2v12594 [Hermanssonia centrifuga]|uniref:DH domain-containing protein n=1 Tax=Hermanssonia centrifuga TaxID=98765 RepID=A0A2R6NGT3_9APHY|nr:hypothetical protein PHLCEN_2v12594 [Hermanssonia centrifuga]